MRSGTENKASNRILTDHLSPKSKVKDPTHQQSSNPAETPMKPSQVTNRLSNPTTRRALPLQSPELYQKERRGSQNQLPHSRGSLYLPGQVPVSSARERTCPPQHFPQPTGLTCMSRMAPTTTATSDARTQPRPPIFCLPTSPQTRKDFNNHSVSSHLRSDQVCMSGGIGATAVGHKSNQDEHQNQTQSGELTQVDLNLLSLKRHRECEDFDSGSKKQRTQQAHAVKAQTPKPAAGEPLRTSLVSRPSLERSKVLGSTPNSVDGASHTQSSGVRSLNLDSRPTVRLPQSPKPYANTQPSTGAKQALIKSSHTEIVKLTEIGLPSRSAEDNIMEKAEEKDKRAKSALSSDFSRKHKHVSRSRHHSSHCEHNTSDMAVKTTSRAKQTEDVRTSDSSAPKPSSKPASGSQSCRMAERNKMHRQRKPVVDDDIDQLFAPDPMTFIVNPVDKTVKLMKDVVKVKPATPERSTSPGAASTSGTPLTASSCHKETRHTEKTQIHCSSSAPTVCLKRIKTKDLIPYRSSSVTSSSRQTKEDSVSSDSSSVSQCASPLQTSSTKQTSTSNQPPPALLERRASAEGRKQVSEVDSLDAELNLDLSLALDLDVSQTSHSSEEEELLSLQELMARVTKPAPATPVKGTFPLPSTPGHRGCLPKTHRPSCTAQTGVYKNNLDQMLKDIHTKKKAKEIETELLTACEEDRLRIAEYEEAEENQEEGISTEQQEFLQRYSLMSNAIREVPPGEVVFNLEKQGCIFNQNSLQLRQCMVNPQGTAQKTLLWSSPAGLRWHINCGLLQEAYDCLSPCPTQVTQFLFKMMSVHTERIVSEKILQALFDIANTAADQIVNNGNQRFKVWVPSLADVTLILMNMGVAFVSLFPFENLQPPFTEGDLLVNVYIRNEIPASNTDDNTFPEHNCNNVLKYLLHCMELCPKAYSDDELLLLLNVVGRVALDTQLILQCSIDLQTLQNKIINNFREWDTMLPRICSAFTDLTQDHHNMCLLVQWLPYNPRGKELRRHLSMSMISKLLDGACKYKPTENEFRLVVLRPYLSRMQPSALLRSMLSSSRRSNKDTVDVDMASLDKQSYYLCYSLLTLANEASNFQFVPVHQKEHLLILCSELETYVKCDIRESEKCLYRSKVKDLVARIYTKWQMLLQRTRPLHSKLYDYWKPLSGNTVPLSPEMHAADNSEEDENVTEEHPVTDEEEEESSQVEESGVAGITSITGETEDDGADITGETEEDGADITGEAEDDGTDINGEAENEGANITGEAEDKQANITGKAEDEQANITGKAEDKQADITGEANNEGADIAGEAENEKGNITEEAVNEGAGVTEEAESEGPSNA